MQAATPDDPERLRIADAVRELVREKAPALCSEAPHDDVVLGRGGLGVDSVALVELLLECERRFSAPFDAELLADGPLTLGRLIEHVARAPRRR